MPATALARARQAVGSGAQGMHLLLAAVLCLVATLLVQAPLVSLDTGIGVYLVRSWDLVWIAFAVLTAMWVVQSRPGRAAFARAASAPMALFGLWIIVCLLSLALTWATFGSSGFADSVVRGVRLAGVLLLAWVVAQVATDRRGDWLVLFILAISALAAAAAAVIWLTQEKALGAEVVGITRAGGPFGNYFADGLPKEWWAGTAGPNNLGLWLATAAATAVFGSRDIAHRFRNQTLGWAVVVAGVSVLATGLLATHSRESWLAAAATFVVLAVLRPGEPHPWRARGLVVLVLLGVILFAAIPTVSGRIADSFTPGTFSYETGPRARLDAWHDGLSWGWKRFPVGWGLGSMEEHPASFGRATAENVYLQSFVGAGVLGLLLLLAAVITALRAALQGYAEAPDRLTGVLPGAFFTAFFVHGLFGNSLSDPTIETLFGCALGLLLVGSRTRSTVARPTT